MKKPNVQFPEPDALPKGIFFSKNTGYTVRRTHKGCRIQENFKMDYAAALAFRNELFARKDVRIPSHIKLLSLEETFRTGSFNPNFDKEMHKLKQKFNPYKHSSKQYCLDMVELIYRNLDLLIERLATFPAEKD